MWVHRDYQIVNGTCDPQLEVAELSAPETIKSRSAGSWKLEKEVDSCVQRQETGSWPLTRPTGDRGSAPQGGAAGSTDSAGPDQLHCKGSRAGAVAAGSRGLKAAHLRQKITSL